MSDKKKIRVYLVKKDYLEESLSVFNRIYLEVWDKIKNKLSYKYNFEEINIKPDYEKYFDMLDRGEFDILVSPVFITNERNKKCSFSVPLYVSRPLIVYPILVIMIIFSLLNFISKFD